LAVFAVDVPLRWVDLDAQAHVNNALVVDYLQEARVRALLSGPLGSILSEGVVVVAHQVEYLAPIHFERGPVRVELRLGNVRAASYSYSYALSQAGAPVARARTDACLFDFAAQRPRRLSPAERAWFASVAEPVEPLPGLGAFRVGAAAHELPVTVRWSDLDSYGHVNNVQFFSYTGEARVALSRELGAGGLRLGPGEASGTLLVARQDLRYLAQLSHRLEPYAVRTAVARVGTTSVTFVHEIVDPLDGRVFARSLAVLVHADAEGRPRPVPDALRAAAGRWPAVAG